jgi:hypothetical protein
MTHADELTKPERFTERVQAKRQRALMAADRRRHGNCCICQFRETTFGIIHCKAQPERQRGFCAVDKKLPQFAFDDSTLEKYRNAS